MRPGPASVRAACALALCTLAACAPRTESVPAVAPPAIAEAPAGPPWPRPEVLELALAAHTCGWRRGVVAGSTLTIIDYSLPSSERRLWVIDVARRQVLFHEYVSHGEGSGGKWAYAFSNREGSHQSSLGLFRTADTYVGGYGYSLRLEGLEPGVNDRAMERNIVMHGAEYASPRLVERIGRLGTSWGCPTLPRETARPVIDRIKGGSAVFAYYPDRQWLTRSEYLACTDMRVATR